MTVRFDDSLPALARIVSNTLTPEALATGAVLRDATGRLAFFSAEVLDANLIERLSEELRGTLGAYARTDRLVAGRDDYGVGVILQDPSIQTLSVEGLTVRFIDRRLVGADWLRPPTPSASRPSRFVFASLKGGVGRSTALAVAAADLASRGRRVLAIDLDMEAPGLGSMLLDETTRPEFGLIDALVENGLSQLDDRFLADLTGPSALAGGRGRIDVIPAFGGRSLRNPGDVLSKISRAYAEDIGPTGVVKTILDQVRDLVDRFADPTRYDAILVDARAGLHETTASAILGLGAEVLLFGRDEPQTFEGYRALLTSLARFIRPGEPAPEWLSRLTMVHAKASGDRREAAEFSEKCRMLFTDAGLSRPRASGVRSVRGIETSTMSPAWNDDLRDDEVLPDEDWETRMPLAVYDDLRFRRFNPLQDRDVLSEPLYRATFSVLLGAINEAVSASLGEVGGA